VVLLRVGPPFKVLRPLPALSLCGGLGFLVGVLPDTTVDCAWVVVVGSVVDSRVVASVGGGSVVVYGRMPGVLDPGNRHPELGGS